MILHLDADSFFASCEQAAHPELRDKPVVVGGVVTAASYQAKALGVKRGMPTWQLKHQFPDVLVVNSDYQSYEQYSSKIFDIICTYTPEVEPYSIDESFADMTSIDIMRNQTWEEIALDLQTEIWKKLNIGVSIGIAPTKVLSKIASGWHKPKGLTVIRNQQDIQNFLHQVPIQDVWGIGWRTQTKMLDRNIRTAYDFYCKSPHWISKTFPKPFLNIYRELHGIKVLNIDSQPKESYDSISKTKTFYPYTSDKSKLFSYLVRNMDRALEKCRRYNLLATHIIIFLKTHAPNAQFKRYFAESKLDRATHLPQDILPVLHGLFDKVYSPKYKYRATGVILPGLIQDQAIQIQLTESGQRLNNKIRLVQMVDQVRIKYGHSSVYVGSAYHAMKHINPISERVGLKVKVSF